MLADRGDRISGFLMSSKTFIVPRSSLSQMLMVAAGYRKTFFAAFLEVGKGSVPIFCKPFLNVPDNENYMSSSSFDHGGKLRTLQSSETCAHEIFCQFIRSYASLVHFILKTGIIFHDLDFFVFVHIINKSMVRLICCTKRKLEIYAL